MIEPGTAAFLAACVTGIIGPLVTLKAKDHLDTKKMPLIDECRQGALTGKWYGIIHEDAEQHQFRTGIKMTLQLVSTERSIIGTAESTIEMPDGSSAPYKFSFKGPFRHNRFAHLEYCNADGSVLQFGTLVVELSDGGLELTGKFVGYGSRSGRIIHGNVRFEKV